MRLARAIAGFCVDFVVGDDAKIASAVVLALGATVALLVTPLPDRWAAVAGGVFVMAAFVVALLVDTRQARPGSRRQRK